MEIIWVDKQGTKSYWTKTGRIGRYEVTATRQKVFVGPRNSPEVRVLYSLRLDGKFIWGPGGFAEFRAVVRRLNCEDFHMIAS